MKMQSTRVSHSRATKKEAIKKITKVCEDQREYDRIARIKPEMEYPNFSSYFSNDFRNLFMISIDDIKICKCVYGVWIYSVNIDEWVFKIGYTSNFYNRFEKLFNEHCKEEIHEGVIQRKILQKEGSFSIVPCFMVSFGQDSQDIEAYIHKCLEKYKHPCFKRNREYYDGSKCRNIDQIYTVLNKVSDKYNGIELHYSEKYKYIEDVAKLEQQMIEV